MVFERLCSPESYWLITLPLPTLMKMDVKFKSRSGMNLICRVGTEPLLAVSVNYMCPCLDKSKVMWIWNEYHDQIHHVWYSPFRCIYVYVWMYIPTCLQTYWRRSDSSKFVCEFLCLHTEGTGCPYHLQSSVHDGLHLLCKMRGNHACTTHSLSIASSLINLAYINCVCWASSSL